MKNKNCNHHSFWQIYTIINFNRTFSNKKGIEFKCKNCNKKCILSWKGYKDMKNNLIKSFFVYLMWLLPAIILILSVAFGYLNYLVAIGLIIAYHFAAMIYIIDSPRLKIIEK